MEFKISKIEIEKMNTIKHAIQLIYGSYGNFEYKFKITGIGVTVSFYSDLADKWFDITDLNSW